MTFKVRCPNCGTEFEFSEDDVDVDYDVERVESKNVELSITVTVRCPKCGRKVLQGVETVSIALRMRGEVE